MRLETSNVRTAPWSATTIVRDARPADLAAMRDVVRAAFTPYSAVLPPAVFAPYLADLLDFDRHGRDGQLLVVEIDGRIRGSGAFYPDTVSQGVGWPPGWAGGRALAVHPAARGKGAARALLAECERRARLAGTRVFAFHTVSFMTEAVALYERLGYLRAPEFDFDMSAHYGVAASTPTVAIAYRRDLYEAAPRPVGTRSYCRPTPVVQHA